MHLPDSNLHRVGEHNSLAVRSQAAVMNEELGELRWAEASLDEWDSVEGDIGEQSVEKRLKTKTSMALERMMEKGVPLSDK